MAEPAASGQVRISFDRVSVEFESEHGRLKVVDDVSYTIANGEFVSIIGPSGCGKTTMMNIVAGFMRPTSGTVLLDGKPVKGPGPERGVIFQEYGVFPWLSVEDNIAFGLKLAANKVPETERAEVCRRYMRLMGLADFAKAYPKTLSGGMRQRLAIARTYAVGDGEGHVVDDLQLAVVGLELDRHAVEADTHRSGRAVAGIRHQGPCRLKCIRVTLRLASSRISLTSGFSNSYSVFIAPAASISSTCVPANMNLRIRSSSLAPGYRLRSAATAGASGSGLSAMRGEPFPTMRSRTSGSTGASSLP